MIDPSGHPDPPLGMPDPPKDWFEFWVRFTCGALFGLVMGGLLWLRGFWRLELGWLAMPAAGLACASAAARCGDNFWVRFLGWFRRWRVPAQHLRRMQACNESCLGVSLGL